jgi:hypothetical protein
MLPRRSVIGSERRRSVAEMKGLLNFDLDAPNDGIAPKIAV